MKYTTSVTKIENGKEFVRGVALEDLVKNQSFAASIYLLLKGELPSKEYETMFNALLVSAIDHGPGTASAQTARITASAKNSMHTSIAAGILAMGERHGGAIQTAAQFFETNLDHENPAELVANLKAEKIRLPGYGHAVLEVDHRSTTLLSIAQELGIKGKYCEFAELIHKELNAISSKTLPLNIDGSMAAILLDMGFPPSVMRGIFIIARAPGLVAQVHEEQENDQGLRRLSEDEIEYEEKT